MFVAAAVACPAEARRVEEGEGQPIANAVDRRRAKVQLDARTGAADRQFEWMGQCAA